ncbi:MAG: hypothetical protein IPK52_07745 [Chloroflexi bacterium]|nr:hypothetical protein [Chloroflexota bacterium]
MFWRRKVRTIEEACADKDFVGAISLVDKSVELAKQGKIYAGSLSYLNIFNDNVGHDMTFRGYAYIATQVTREFSADRNLINQLMSRISTLMWKAIHELTANGTAKFFSDAASHWIGNTVWLFVVSR